MPQTQTAYISLIGIGELLSQIHDVTMAWMAEAAMFQSLQYIQSCSRHMAVT